MSEARTKTVTIRMTPQLWEAIGRCAKDSGVSASAYIREAAIARTAYTAGRAGDPKFEKALELAHLEDTG